MDRAGQLRQYLREPLVHFLIAGFLVFFVSSWRGEAIDPASRTITVSEDQVARLAASWQQMWRRPPSPREIDAMIRDYIKEEVYYREARRLGLDEDDTVIRRRLRVKMEYLAGAEVESARPSDATLAAWLDKYPARFAPDAVLSFDQIYLGPDDTGKAAAIMAAVSAGADWTAQGEKISLPGSVERVRHSEIERQFGPDFAKSVAALPEGGWSGPVASGFGLHLVRLRNVQVLAKPILADVRQAVENDWRAATYKQREAKAYQALLDGYTIRIAKP
jgi:peptidyl-prolyl cis-trans isomerase C